MHSFHYLEPVCCSMSSSNCCFLTCIQSSQEAGGLVFPCLEEFCTVYCWASPVAQTVKHLPTMRETRVQFLGQKDLLEKEMATCSSILAWKIPWMEEPGRLQSMGSHRVGHNWSDLTVTVACRYHATTKGSLSLGGTEQQLTQGCLTSCDCDNMKRRKSTTG